MAQGRPSPESAPVIDLPEPEPVDVAEEEIDKVPVVEETVEELSQPIETELIEVITGSEEPFPLTRSPLRRPVAGGKVILSFFDVSIDETMGFIAQTTGKVVIPVNAVSLRSKKITLRNDEPIERSMALDLLFQAFRLNQVGVIERDDIIIIGPLDSMLSDIGDIPVLGADDDVMQRQDRGTIVIKVFSVEVTEAQVIGDRINEMFPDYGSLTVYPDSNQLVLLGDIGLCQQIQDLIHQLDRIWRSGKLKTYRLKYADASEISDNILDLFEDSGTTRSQPSNRTNNSRARTAPSVGADEVELRLTVNMQQNSVTVQAEPDVMTEIETLIVEEWDLPRPTETSKLYVLEYSDPIKIRNLLQEILGDGSSSSGGGGRGGNAQRADVTQAVSGVYRFEAYPDKNALLVLSKTEESFAFLDSIIEAIDQPTEVGMPKIIELKHADAVALTQELNALLSAPGVSATIDKPDTGLSGEGFGDAAVDSDNETGGQMTFPWQQGGANADDQSPESTLISKVRLVPIVRQNAIAVLSPPAYLNSIVDVIEKFDRPTRQVMISATIAAVTLTDDLKLGLRWGSGSSAGVAGGDASIGGQFSGQANDLLSGILRGTGLFTLTNINIALDALDQITNVRVIQQPRTFTSDNNESVFFNGQEVPIQTSSTIVDGQVQQGIDYRDVGVLLNVRPRITSHGSIDLTINVELSEVSSATSSLTSGGNPIFARRQVRSQVQLKDGETVLIGGILKESESKVKRKFPLLGDIPLIGGLFSSIEDSDVREELLVFITPTIVDTTSQESWDESHNQVYLERLKEISLPIDEQRRKQFQNFQENESNDFITNQFLNPGVGMQKK